MSQNRSDWFNPNNPSFYIRQAQLAGGSISYSSVSSGCGGYNTLESYCLLNSLERSPEEIERLFRQNMREAVNEGIFTHNEETDEYMLTKDTILMLKNFLETRAKNLERCRKLIN